MKLLRAAIAGMAILAMPSRICRRPAQSRTTGLRAGDGTIYNWTGFYLGGNIGYAWRNPNHRDFWRIWVTLATTVSCSAVKWAIIGRSTNSCSVWSRDFDWAVGEKATPFVTTANLGLVQGRVGISSWVTTLAARFGYAADRWLFYTKLGAGWTKTNVSLQSPVLGVLATNDKSNVGWLDGSCSARSPAPAPSPRPAPAPRATLPRRLDDHAHAYPRTRSSSASMSLAQSTATSGGSLPPAPPAAPSRWMRGDEGPRRGAVEGGFLSRTFARRRGAGAARRRSAARLGAPAVDGVQLRRHRHRRRRRNGRRGYSPRSSRNAACPRRARRSAPRPPR